MSHTPQPWVLVKNGATWSLESADLNDNGDYVAEIYNQEDAEFIHRACRERADLVAALRELAEQMEGANLYTPQSMRMSIMWWAKKARATLAKAEGKS